MGTQHIISSQPAIDREEWFETLKEAKEILDTVAIPVLDGLRTLRKV